MQIAVVGPGGIGSTFAFQLARAGHEVTVVARGQRLEQLRRDPAIERATGERASVAVSAALDPTTPWDLVLVTVLGSQVDAVLPALAASAAKTVMFMFNTFAPLDRLRAAVGAARFAFGFPAIIARLEGGKLVSRTYAHGQITTVTDQRWAELFRTAGIPTVRHADLESWLRTHAAFIVPLMILGVRTHARRAGAPWAEATELARAMKEGFRLVRQLGNTITPAPMALVSRVPSPLIATALWLLSRTALIRNAGALGPAEPRTLIDAMRAAAPAETPRLLAVRP